MLNKEFFRVGCLCTVGPILSHLLPFLKVLVVRRFLQKCLWHHMTTICVMRRNHDHDGDTERDKACHPPSLSPTMSFPEQDFGISSRTVTWMGLSSLFSPLSLSGKTIERERKDSRRHFFSSWTLES